MRLMEGMNVGYASLIKRDFGSFFLSSDSMDATQDEEQKTKFLETLCKAATEDRGCLVCTSLSLSLCLSLSLALSLSLSLSLSLCLFSLSLSLSRECMDEC